MHARQGKYCRCFVLLVVFYCTALSLSTLHRLTVPPNVSSTSLHQENRRTESIGPNETCRRRCFSRPNKILFTHVNGAGLNDRTSVVKHLLQLAGYLCATLQVPRPHLMFNPGHNAGKRVSTELMWSDFWEVLSLDDMIYSSSSSSGGSIMADLDEPYDTSKHSDGIHLVHARDAAPEQIIDQFEELEEFTFIQQQETNHKNGLPPGFIWRIDQKFNKFQTTLGNYLEERRNQASNNVTIEGIQSPPYSRATSLPMWYHQGRSRGCLYAELLPPQHLLDLVQHAQRVVTNISRENAVYGYFHIRRGDAKEDCNTELSKIRTYLTCSLNQTETLGNVTLLFSSDEKDQNYRKSLQEMVERETAAQFIDMDALLWEQLHRAVESFAPKRRLNNFYVFRAISVLSVRLSLFTLERRRHYKCNDCDPVMNMVRVRNLSKPMI